MCKTVSSNEAEQNYLNGLYLFDETALKIALRENDDQSLAVGLIYLDNYEEALETVEDVRRSLLLALIDRKINKYIAFITMAQLQNQEINTSTILLSNPKT